MFPLLKYTAEEVDEYYAKVTPEMVRASLAKDRHDWFDLLNLVSPAAYPFMDEMRRKARLARIKYYGDMKEEFKCTIPYNMLSVGLSVGKEASTVEITHTSDKVKMTIFGENQEVFMIGDMYEGEFPVLEKVFEKYREGKVRGRFGVKELTNALTSVKDVVKANCNYVTCFF